MPIGSISFQGYPAPVSARSGGEPAWGPRSRRRRRSDGGRPPPRGRTPREAVARRARRVPRRRQRPRRVGGVLSRRVGPEGRVDRLGGLRRRWSKPVAETPAHEVGHTQGLKHVACRTPTATMSPTRPPAAPSTGRTRPGCPRCAHWPRSTPTGTSGSPTTASPSMIYSNDPDPPTRRVPVHGLPGPGWTDPYHWCLLSMPTASTATRRSSASRRRTRSRTSIASRRPPATLQLELCSPTTSPRGTATRRALGVRMDAADTAPTPWGWSTITLQAEGIVRHPLDPESWVIASGTIDPHERTGSIPRRRPHRTWLLTGAAVRREPSRSWLPEVRTAFALQLVGRCRPWWSCRSPSTGGRRPVAAHGGGAGAARQPATSRRSPWVEGAIRIAVVVDGAVVPTARVDQRHAAGGEQC